MWNETREKRNRKNEKRKKTKGKRGEKNHSLKPTPFFFASASSPFSSVHRAPLSISPFQSSLVLARPPWTNHPRDSRSTSKALIYVRQAPRRSPPNYPLRESLNNRGNVSSTNNDFEQGSARGVQNSGRAGPGFPTIPGERTNEARACLVVEEIVVGWLDQWSRPTCNPFISRVVVEKQCHLVTLVVLAPNPQIRVAPSLLFSFLFFFFFSSIFCPVEFSRFSLSFLVERESNFCRERFPRLFIIVLINLTSFVYLSSLFRHDRFHFDPISARCSFSQLFLFFSSLLSPVVLFSGLFHPLLFFLRSLPALVRVRPSENFWETPPLGNFSFRKDDDGEDRLSPLLSRK